MNMLERSMSRLDQGLGGDSLAVTPHGAGARMSHVVRALGVGTADGGAVGQGFIAQRVCEAPVILSPGFPPREQTGTRSLPTLAAPDTRLSFLVWSWHRSPNLGGGVLTSSALKQSQQ